MKLTIQASLLALAALGAAQLQTLSDLPNCAKPCARTLPAQCNLGVQCICADQAFITSISCCIATACSPADQQKTLQVAQQLCDTVNVKLPQAASCSGSSSAAASGAGTASSATSAMSATASSAMSSASSMTASSLSSGASAASATGSSTSTTGSSTTAATTAASGAAQNLGSNMGAVGAAVAALALL